MSRIVRWSLSRAIGARESERPQDRGAGAPRVKIQGKRAVVRCDPRIERMWPTLWMNLSLIVTLEVWRESDGNDHTSVAPVVIADSTSRAVMASRVQRARQQDGRVGVYVVGTEGNGTHLRLRSLALSGVDEVFLVAATQEAERASRVVALAAHVTHYDGGHPPAPECSHAHVAPIVRWIWRNAHTDPSVDDVANHFGIGRRSIERALAAMGLPGPGVLVRSAFRARMESLRASGSLTWREVSLLLNVSPEALAMRRRRNATS